MQETEEDDRQRQLLRNEMQLVLRKKVELMQVWTLFMLNNDHRCVMSHIRAKVLQNVSITEDDLKVFKDYMNILDDLKVGFLITIIERRVDKELRKQIHLNMQFFKILPDLLKKINDRIKPELDKITNFDSVIKKHMCTNCHAEKAEEELKFMGRKWKCECGASSYMPVIEDKARKSRLEKLQLLTTIITGLKNELDKLETELDNKNKHKQRANEDKKISELERLLLVIRKKTNPKKAQPLKIEKNYKNLQMAQQKFAPRKRFQKIEEIEAIQRARKIVKH